MTAPRRREAVDLRYMVAVMADAQVSFPGVTGRLPSSHTQGTLAEPGFTCNCGGGGGATCNIYVSHQQRGMRSSAGESRIVRPGVTYHLGAP